MQPAVAPLPPILPKRLPQGLTGRPDDCAAQVLASYGHVRDLPARSAAVRPDDGFAVRWALLPGADARLAQLAEAMRGADSLVLATDPDREGEAIAWHVTQELQARRRGLAPCKLKVRA